MSDILQMNYQQIQDYIKAAEFDRNERLVMLMNVMAVAFGGSAKSRRELSDSLLGIGKPDFDPDAFKNIFDHLATPVDAENEADPAKKAIIEWALTEFDVNDPAFKVK
jgi:hypothetical protein